MTKLWGYVVVYIICAGLSSGPVMAEVSEVAKLMPTDGAADDYFGNSVAVSGDYAIIGTYFDDDNGTNSGSAYIFKHEGDSWTQQVKLLPLDGAAYDNFGESVSLSGDYAIVGAKYDDDTGSSSGSAYIFKRDGETWTQQAKLLASDGASSDSFGNSVAISGDYAIVGAVYDDDNGSSSGSAYMFVRDGENWVEQDKVTASDGTAGAYFGWSVAISGEYAIVGAYPSVNDNYDYTGAAYLFKRDGETWAQQAKLLASDGAAYDRFGWSVAISGDYAVVGAYWDDDNGSSSGSTYIFARDGIVWAEQAKLTASDGAAGDYFGYSVAIDGDNVIVGAMWDSDMGFYSGSAYVFQRDGISWPQQEKLLASDGAANDEFGGSVSIHGDWMVVGAKGNDDNGSQSGSAYVIIQCPFSDLTGDCFVNLEDFELMSEQWLVNYDIEDLEALANQWLSGQEQ